MKKLLVLSVRVIFQRGEAMHGICEQKVGRWRKAKLSGGILLLFILPFMLGGCDWIGNWLNPNQDPVVAPPSNLRIVSSKFAPGGREHLLSWDDNSDNEAGFLIQRKMTVYNPWSEVPDVTPFVKIGKVGPNVSTYKNIAPLAAYVLVYRVAAIAADGRLSEWATFDVVTAWGEKPTELQAEVSGPPLHVKLSWKDNSRNELGFRIYRWTGIGEGPWLERPDTEWPLLGTVGADVETFTDTKVKSGYTHRYFVIAFTDDESSLPSNVETVFIVLNQQSKIAFVSNRDGNPEIYVMNADGTNLRRLTYNPAEDNYQDWSPDGKKIAFTSNRDGNSEIYVMNTDGSNQRRLTYNSAFDYRPRWSPDGTKIAFERSHNDGITYDICVINADGSNERNLTNRPTTSDFFPRWLPDGSKIVFGSLRDGNSEIYVMDADGVNQHNLTNNPAVDWNPMVSPDGTKIAFASGRGGNYEPNYDIYVMNANGSNGVHPSSWTRWGQN